VRASGARLSAAQTDLTVVTTAVSGAGVRPGDHVLEVGPGTGVLTAALLAAGARVTALEKDAELAAALLSNNAELVASGALRVVQDDVLRWLRSPEAREAFPDAAPGQPLAKVVANIPYGISTDLLSALLPRGAAFASLTLLVQEELAQRLVVHSAGASDAREMSLRVRFYSAPRYLRHVPRDCFKPPPNVDSAVVAFDLRPPATWPLPPGPRTAAFFGFLRSAFASRRKVLRKLLASLPGSDSEAAAAALGKAGVAADARPQELPLESYLLLFSQLMPEKR